MSRFKRKMASRQPLTFNLMNKKKIKGLVMLWADDWREIQHWCEIGRSYFLGCVIVPQKMSFPNFTLFERDQRILKFKNDMMSAEIDKLITIGTVSSCRGETLKKMLFTEDLDERMMYASMIEVLREQRVKDK